MQDLFENLNRLPTTYYVGVLLLVLLTAEALHRFNELRGVFMAVVYATIAMWYFMDPATDFRAYTKFSPSEMELAFGQVCIFLISFRAFFELAPRTPTKALRRIEEFDFDRGPLLKIVLISWVILFVIGVSRVKFNVFNALFPIEARTNYTAYMWWRPQFGTATSWLVSVAGYLYSVVCSFFGLMAVVTKRTSTRRRMILMMCLTWPMFALTGTRHIALTVVAPTILCTLLTKRWPAWKMATFTLMAGMAINIVMLAAIEFRNTGFGSAVSEGSLISRLQRARHQGMNMAEELMYMNRYQQTGRLQVVYGMNYLENILNVIPRAIWEGKPFVGYDFARLRVGLYKGTTAATISFGIVGQGVNNFGQYFGPVVAALILALYGRWSFNILKTGHYFLRCCVLFVAIAKVPNLGRDITLFDLWLVVFAYVATLAYERFVERQARRRTPKPTAAARAPGRETLRTG